MKKLLPALLVLTVLAGCATTAQQKSQQIATQLNSTLQSMNSCLRSLLENPVAHRLMERFIFDINDPQRVEKLALRAHVTEQEAKDLIEYSVLTNPCKKMSIEGLSKVHPEYVASMARFFSGDDTDTAKLINNEITIGDLNQGSINRVNQLMTEFSQINQHIQSQLNQEHRYELAQRQIAAQVLQTWAYQQQVLYNQQRLINNTMRPITTNCQYIGNTLHCTQF